MEWGEKEARDGVAENGLLKVRKPPTAASVSSSPPTVKKAFDGNDAFSYANFLRSTNKFADALRWYESVLEKDKSNVDAFIGKGICLQMQDRGRLAFESFVEAIKLDPQNAFALTHCGILYEDEGLLL